MEVFFHAEGESAPEADEDNPNKIVYWRQMANDLGFDSQAAEFVYDGDDDYKPGTEETDDDGEVTGGRIGEYKARMTGSGGNTQLGTDRITIWRKGATAAFRFVETLHHENGHRQSLFAPGVEGGWGAGNAFGTKIWLKRRKIIYKETTGRI